MNLLTSPKTWQHTLIKTIFGQNFRTLQPLVFTLQFIPPWGVRCSIGLTPSRLLTEGIWPPYYHLAKFWLFVYIKESNSLLSSSCLLNHTYYSVEPLRRHTCIL
jgi:hypothetical protein